MKNYRIDEKKHKHIPKKVSFIRYGLGIDAGGTYTDAVIYDFENDMLTAKSKSLTTPWDFTIGIKKALSCIKIDLIKKVELVSVSTTLATNAIVEGQGQKVGLLVMPPYDLFEPQDIPHEPVRVISGRLEIDGSVIQHVDVSQVRKICRELIKKYTVEAFAVSGYASTINPEHEIQVKQLLMEETGLCVTCGHELSELLNFRTRAITAVLNARIIPQVKQFIRELKKTLHEMDIAVPIAVVKGDGSLESISMSLERPVETILSGSAASVAGARNLTGINNALVIDMGGTSADIGSINDGLVRECPDGAVVRGKKTHVQALDVRTIGLGGDSLIQIIDRKVRIGPISVAPLAWLSTVQESLDKSLGYLQKNIESYENTTEPMQILALTQVKNEYEWSEKEIIILEALKKRPRSVDELAEITEVKNWRLVPLERMEKANVIHRCGLTPMDLLHVNHQYNRWDRDAADHMCEMISFIARYKKEMFLKYIIEQIAQKIAVELICKMLDEGNGQNYEIHKNSAFQAIIDNWLKKRNSNFQVNFALKVPVIGVGAPIHYFLPRATKILCGKCIIPENADVASAIGAITSKVVICKHAKIHSHRKNEFVIEGLRGRRVFNNLEEAHKYTVRKLEELVREMGNMAGTSERKVEIHIDDTHIEIPKDDYFFDEDIFVERTLSARLCGQPDITKLETQGICK